MTFGVSLPAHSFSTTYTVDHGFLLRNADNNLFSTTYTVDHSR